MFCCYCGCLLPYQRSISRPYRSLNILCFTYLFYSGDCSVYKGCDMGIKYSFPPILNVKLYVVK